MYQHYWLLTVFVPICMALRGIPLDDFNRISNPKIGPKGMPYNKTTSCQTFGKNARFNPRSVVRTKWFVFYYWSTPNPYIVYEFWIPNKKDLQLLHFALDGHLPARFNWSATLVMMRNELTNHSSLLEERGDRGQYVKYSIYRGMPNGTMTDYINIRLKQTGDNKYLGMMDCKKQTAYIMSRINEVPLKRDLQDEAAKLGYRGRKGKSYLYQGHEWMPIPEMDEGQFWLHTNSSSIELVKKKGTIKSRYAMD